MSSITPDIAQALQTDRVIDITTTGRKSGKPSRIEIWFLRVGDQFYITGTPGKRDWFANLNANPDFTFHLKQSLQADLSASARVIGEESERREVLDSILQSFGRPTSELPVWVEQAPLVEVTFV